MIQKYECKLKWVAITILWIKNKRYRYSKNQKRLKVNSAKDATVLTLNLYQIRLPVDSNFKIKIWSKIKKWYDAHLWQIGKYISAKYNAIYKLNFSCDRSNTWKKAKV